VCVAVIVGGVWPVGGYTQDRFGAVTRTVEVPVSVTDSRGNAVRSLNLSPDVMVYGLGCFDLKYGPLVGVTSATHFAQFDQPRGGLSALFKEFIDELHVGYLLGVVPVGLDGTTHRLDVRVRGRSGLVVNARATYLADVGRW